MLILFLAILIPCYDFNSGGLIISLNLFHCSHDFVCFCPFEYLLQWAINEKLEQVRFFSSFLGDLLQYITVFFLYLYFLHSISHTANTRSQSTNHYYSVQAFDSNTCCRFKFFPRYTTYWELRIRSDTANFTENDVSWLLFKTRVRWTHKTAQLGRAKVKFLKKNRWPRLHLLHI